MLYEQFHTSWKSALKESLWLKNIHQIPEIVKIVVSMGIWSTVTRKWLKDFSDLESNLNAITGQKWHLVYSKQAISNFKLREWQPVMLKTTLRWKKAYDFLDRLVTYVFPRIRDFNWLSSKKFDNKGNYHFGFASQSIFPELHPESIVTNMGIQVTIHTSTDSIDMSKSLLQSLWCIFH